MPATIHRVRFPNQRRGMADVNKQIDAAVAARLSFLNEQAKVTRYQSALL